MLFIACLTLLVFAAVCAASDYLTGKIPNTLICCGLLCGIVARVVLFQAGGHLLPFLLDMAAGFLLPYLLLGVLVLMGMLGGGDVKLLSVIGLQLGAGGCLVMVWYSLLAAGGVSVLVVWRRKNLRRRLEYLMCYVQKVMRDGQTGPYREMTPDGAESGTFPFAVPVFLALGVYLTRHGMR